jgi:hypothetical protein
MIFRDRRHASRGAAFAALITLPVSGVTVSFRAFAQVTVLPGGPAAPAPAATGGNTTTTQGPTTTTTTTTLSPYAPPGASDNKGPIGGGNVTESSGRPKTGNEEDTFDLGRQRGEGGGSAHGSSDGPIFDSGGGGAHYGGEVPYQHIVRRGDTLWGICDFYFHNPYQWPRVWSYNAQIQNPHWIYPGDQLKLRNGGGSGVAALNSSSQASAYNFTDRRRQVPSDTVFLRDEGFVEDAADENWGEITGSPLDKMFLTSPDEVYLHVSDKKDVRIGQELTIFRPVRTVSQGQVIQIQGTVRVNQWNEKERVARGTITESLDVIERGSRVGPVGRRFQVIPPVRNEAEVRAHILASVHPHNFYGQNAVLFLDKGALDGLKPGNRLFIIRRGDAWRRSLATPGAANRISPESEKTPEMEKTPGTRDENHYPDEVVGELRILAVRPHTSTCLVTQSKAEIEKDDVAVSRKGY